MKRSVTFYFAGVIGVASSLLCAQNAAGETVAEFYKDKQIKLIISSGAGGGYDAYARTFARHASKHIPGNPVLIPQNMPGAGGLRAANYLYTVAPKDGSVIAVVHRGVPMAPVLGIKSAEYDVTKFNWIGSFNNEVSVCIAWHTAPQNTIADVQKTELIIGGSGANDTEIYPTAMNNILKTKFRIISGYPSGTAVNLAMERGEVNGRCGWSWTSVITEHLDWVKEKKIKLLMQMSLSKHPDLPDVPLAVDLARSEQDQQILELIFARQVMGRPVVMPPETPADRVAAIRKAFEDTLKDPAFIADADKQRLELTSVTGADVEKLIRKIYATPRTVVALAQDATKYTEPTEKAKIQFETVKGALTEIEKGGRVLKLQLAGGDDVKTKISGSRTAVTVGGAKAKRSALKVGMTCSVTYTGDGTEAKQVDCRN
jgi:tripartite-type tricarboxylate transporter receptor subunit TctC